MSNFSLSIVQWYRQNARKLPWRETKDPYKIWLSEVLLQQTRVDQGLNYYLKFTENYPTIKDLADASEERVLKDWQGLGYYSRARNLHASAKIIDRDFNGVFPKHFHEILKLKGVGNYTAAAIASICFKEPVAVIDGNVYRVLSRVFDIPTPIDTSNGIREFAELANSLIDLKHPDEYNQGVMELGAMVCKPTRPDCMNCPVQINCLSLDKKTIAERPVKLKKIKITRRDFHYLIYQNHEEIVLQKRSNKDIWQHLYEFPLIEGSMPRELAKKAVKISGEKKHVLSHQHIHAYFYHFDGFPDHFNVEWITTSISNIEKFPIPRLIDKYIQEWLKKN